MNAFWMRKLSELILIVLLVPWLLGCAVAPSGLQMEEVVAVSHRTTIEMLRQAKAGAVDVHIFQDVTNPQNLLITWHACEKTIFGFFDTSVKNIYYWGTIQAQITEPAKVAELVKDAKAIGFDEVSVDKVAPALGLVSGKSWLLGILSVSVNTVTDITAIGLAGGLDLGKQFLPSYGIQE